MCIYHFYWICAWIHIVLTNSLKLSSPHRVDSVYEISWSIYYFWCEVESFIMIDIKLLSSRIVIVPDFESSMDSNISIISKICFSESIAAALKSDFFVAFPPFRYELFWVHELPVLYHPPLLEWLSLQLY